VEIKCQVKYVHFRSASQDEARAMHAEYSCREERAQAKISGR